MKITDVSSSDDVEGHHHRSDNEEGKSEESGGAKSTRKQTLLDKYRIPIEQLDFDYVNKCNDIQRIERILRILRSGEEGVYPDLEKCVEGRLEELKPSSRLLRKEMPALRSKELGSDERKDIENGIVEWISALGPKGVEEDETKTIFNSSRREADLHSTFPLPVRGSSEQALREKNAKQPARTAEESNNDRKKKDRIKSWEYDKWDKFDVETELTKLDITDMKREEWEKRGRPKVIQEQERIKKLMKEEGELGEAPSSSLKSVSSSTSTISPKEKPATVTTSPKMEVKELGKSYIEEIDQDDEEEEKGVQVSTPAAFIQNRNSTNSARNFRKTKIVIDDLHVPI